MASTTTAIRTTVVREGPTIKFVSVQQGFISTISGLLTAIEMVRPPRLSHKGAAPRASCQSEAALGKRRDDPLRFSSVESWLSPH
ncbi:hypothetical protein HPB50_013230 [Hyalomma asiaticum]|uniref:Uncharacterized protein n=1 Tax=Hyalomma asiaticum TaxID=266040 RepID=A0ACB7TGV6_HYAAI|nr:hypothetical protein HPB50_013230 [Hyalomma asiaticum]